MLRSIELGTRDRCFNSMYTDDLKDELDDVIYNVYNYLWNLPLSYETENQLIKNEGFKNFRKNYVGRFFYSNNWKKKILKYQKSDNEVLSNYVKDLLKLVGCINTAQSPSVMEKTLGGLAGAFLWSMCPNEAHSPAVIITFLMAVLGGMLLTSELATFKNRQRVMQITDDLYKITKNLYIELHSARDVELLVV